jgi:hypothetical protein
LTEDETDEGVRETGGKRKMAWTTPRTWSAGETVTATIMNTHIRDNLNILKTTIQNDGTILAESITKGMKSLGASVADAANSGTGETSLMSTTILASGFDTNGMAAYIFGGGNGANNANNKRIKLKFDGTIILDTSNFTTELVDGWHFDAMISREDATHAKCSAKWATYTAGVGSAVRAGYVRVTIANWTADRVFLVTGQGGASSDIVQKQQGGFYAKA